jgi:predicted lipoprotein with Yx(FWY)xxD motif
VGPGAGGDERRNGAHVARFSQGPLTAPNWGRPRLTIAYETETSATQTAIVDEMKGLVVLAAVLSALVAAGAVGALPSAQAPVAKLKTKAFGQVLTRRDGQALYYWNVEKKVGGKVRCTGSCAAAWPPFLVASRAAVPKRVPGITGLFGVVRRPDGKLQVTRNKLPLYTYAHEGPRQVLCNNVDGWFVVRL